MKSLPAVFRPIIVLLTIACMPFMSHAQSSAPTSSAVINSLVKKMALKQQVQEAPGEIRLQFEQNPLQLPTETNKQMLQQFDEAYTTNLLLEDFKNALRQEITNQKRQELSQWLNSENAQSVTDARQFYYTLQGKRQQVITRYEMDQDPPSEQRISLISTLTDTTSLTEASVETSVIIFRSVIKALSQLSEQRTLSNAQIDRITNGFRSDMQAQAGGQLNREQLVMYHSLQDQTLENYISFWGTDTGKWLDTAISQSLQAAYQQAADRFLQSIN